MTNAEFAALVADVAPELEKIGEHFIVQALAGSASDPEKEHQLALDLIRSVQTAQAKKELTNP